jgi:hypothetical protein
MKQRFFYSCIGYEAGLCMAVVIELLTGWPFSVLNLLGVVGLIASRSIAEFKGKAPSLDELHRPLSLFRPEASPR